MQTAEPYRWIQAGEEWSRPWGSSAAQWHHTIYPRIAACLPAAHILEIACGFGRWTEYLRRHCDRITAVDSAVECVAACRERFADDPKVTCLANDGSSLAEVADGSVDFAFTFDSLVHTNRATIKAYLEELARVLTSDGRAFVHHSNLGAYPISAGAKLAKPLRQLTENLRLLTRTNQRASDMTAELFRALCHDNGLVCMTQELINWRSSGLIDCLSWLTRRGSQHERGPTEVRRNRDFMREAEVIRRRRQAETAA
ncbi:MAG TPA: class I SAM-dependent methyltransferase [Chthoniobacterales bacterium]